MELLDKRSVKSNGDRWDNFMEIFLSKDGQMPVAQLGFGINWKTMMAWKTQLINDAVNTSGVPPEEVFGANFKLKEEKKYWHWRAAFSLEKLFGGNVDRFKLNFRRKNPDARLCWNRFFASAQDCLEPGIMGDIIIRDLDKPEQLPFAENKFKNEVGTWRMLDGYISFTGKKNEVSVRFTGKKDALIFAEPVGNRKNSSITIRCNSSFPMLATVIPAAGNKRKPGKQQLLKKQKDGSFAATFPPVPGEELTVLFTVKKAVEVKISNVEMIFRSAK